MFFDCGLEQPGIAPPAIAVALEPSFGSPVYVSQRARCNAFEILEVGDVVMGFTETCEFCGQVCLHFRAEPGHVFSVLKTFRCIENHEAWTRWDRRESTASVVSTCQITAAAVWAQSGDFIVVLRGPRMRVLL